MVTVLDLSLLGYFNAIYAVLFVFAILFAILHKTNAISKNASINSIIAISISLMVLISKGLIEVINFMVPWFAITIIFVILLILVFRVFGASENTFSELVGQSTIRWAIIGVSLLIFGAAIASVFGQQLLPVTAGGEVNTTQMDATGNTATGDFEQNIYSILFNQKVLGILILFTVAIFAVILLSSG